MDFDVENSVQALWEDFNNLLEMDPHAGPMLALLCKCKPLTWENGVITVETPMRMVMLKIDRFLPTVEQKLSEAAFEPVQFNLVFNPDCALEPRKTQTQAFTMPVMSTQNASPTPQPQKQHGLSVEYVSAPQTTPTHVPTPEVVAPEPVYQPQPQAQLIHPAGRGLSVETYFEPEPEPQDPERMLQDKVRILKQNNPLWQPAGREAQKMTFENFVVAEENKIVYQAALAIANGDTYHYNPLFIYGRSGMGKTHLLRAIQNYINDKDPSRLCVYMDSTEFINRYTESMSNLTKGAPQALTDYFRDVDILIIDDVQKLSGKQGTIGFFFNTFNMLKDQGKCIVMAADRVPARLGMDEKGFDERTWSRMSSGMIVAIEIPSYEFKIKLIERFCQRLQQEDPNLQDVPVTQELASRMATYSGSNIRIIEGYCQRVMYTMRSIQGDPEIEINTIERLARECWPDSPEQIPVSKIIEIVENAYDITHSEMIGSSRKKPVAEARHVAIYLIREHAGITLEAIGTYFGNRTHSTIKSSCEKIDAMMKEDARFYDKVQKIKAQFREIEK